MSEMKRGEIGYLTKDPYKGYVVVICEDNFAQALHGENTGSRSNGWTSCDKVSLEVVVITDVILKGVLNATK
jgi:hypothetical protein